MPVLRPNSGTVALAGKVCDERYLTTGIYRMARCAAAQKLKSRSGWHPGGLIVLFGDNVDAAQALRPNGMVRAARHVNNSAECHFASCIDGCVANVRAIESIRPRRRITRAGDFSNVGPIDDINSRAVFRSNARSSQRGLKRNLPPVV